MNHEREKNIYLLERSKILLSDLKDTNTSLRSQIVTLIDSLISEEVTKLYNEGEENNEE